MNKAMHWLLIGAITVVIVIPSWLIASFSLFGTSEDTSIFSLDFLVAGIIFSIPLLVIILLILALTRNAMKWVYRGYALATLEMLVLVGIVYSSLPFILFAIGIIVVSIVSIFGIRQVTKRS